MSVFNNPSERSVPPMDRRVSPGSAPTQPTVLESPSEDATRPSVLGKTLVFKGELSADEDLVLQGRVEGSIHHTQNLTVGVDGVVIGDVHARSIVIEGTVEGDLRGSASVLIMATAKVHGNISAPRVGITEGATFNGSVDMGAPQAAAGRATTRGASYDATALSESSVDHILSQGRSA